MRKLLFGLVAALFAGAAIAANVPLQSGPVDPGNLLGFINGLVQSINAYTSGNVTFLPAAVTTGGTSIETDASYTIPANALMTGNRLVITAYGVNSADSNAKTLTFSFGGQTCALTVTGSGQLWQATFSVTEIDSKKQSYECHGTTGTTVVTSAAAATWTVDNTAAIAVLVRQTAATSGTMTLTQANIRIER